MFEQTSAHSKEHTRAETYTSLLFIIIIINILYIIIQLLSLAIPMLAA